jgi:hypothetical protein
MITEDISVVSDMFDIPHVSEVKCTAMFRF